MTTHPAAITMADLREVLWDITCLGRELSSRDDPSLDDADLALDSLAAVWLIVQIERRFGRPAIRLGYSNASFRTVNTLHSLLAEATEDET